jgi:hypothetical protein
MKEFKKTKDGLFICEECGKICTKNKLSLSMHIKYHNIDIKMYYDKWVKEINEGICKICGKETELIKTDIGYKNCCSKKCSNEYTYNKIKNSNLNKYGVENQYQRKDIKEKSKQTKKEKYGNENYVNREKTNETNLKKYGNISPLHGKEQIKMKKQTWIKNLGVENPSQSNKIKKQKEETCFLHFGVKNQNQSKEIREKNKQTCLKKYGVEHPMQNKEIFNKSFKTRIKIKQFRNTNLTYQALYEL